MQPPASSLLLRKPYTPSLPPPTPTPAGIPELVRLLRARGQQVFLVSGGFRQVIHPLALQLGIPLSHVFANQILFGVSSHWWRGSQAASRNIPCWPGLAWP